MEFIRFLHAESDAFNVRLLAGAILTGLLTGAMIGIIALAAESADEELDTLWYIVQYGVCFVVFVRTRRRVLERIATILVEVIGRVRTRISTRIANAPLRQFEHIGKNHFYKVLSQDTVVIGECASPIINAASSVVVIVFALACMAIISLSAVLAVTGMIGLAVLHFVRRQRVVNQALMAAEQQERRFFGLIEHLLEGFKELKISRERRDDLLGHHLGQVAEQTTALRKAASHDSVGLIVFAQSFFYLLIGFMLFVWPSVADVSHDDSVRIVTLILFIIGPVGEAVSGLPAMARADIAINSIYALERLLGKIEDASDELPASPARARPAERATTPGTALQPLRHGPRFGEFTQLRLRNVGFSYNDNERFELGPLDLDIGRGEIVFFVGGNGSGKSTLLRVLTGLYESRRGDIFVDDHMIDEQNLDRYRSLFTIILHDFHLFDRLYGVDEIDLVESQRLLTRMGLHGLTEIEPDGNITRINLSTGQRKRLALVIAVLENRPLLVLDEWAADQDPQFRREFYRHILPELAARGTTIIAATHDDHYFDVATRVYKLHEGKLEPLLS
jgi:putative ATP-binding cassette transporter